MCTNILSTGYLYFLFNAVSGCEFSITNRYLLHIMSRAKDVN